MSKIKWIGGGLGFVLGGPIGAVVGFFLGAMFDDIVDGTYSVDKQSGSYTNNTNEKDAQPGDFAVVLLIFSAAIMKVDGSVKKQELDYVKEYFKRQFGIEKTKQYILLLREILQKDYDLRDVCLQVKHHMTVADRLQLLHYLFGIAFSDGDLTDAEVHKIYTISNYLGIAPADFNSIKAMYVRNTDSAYADSAYTILEISKNATNDEVKKAYKRMAVKYHPDKVSHLGEDVQKAANEKFQKINQAYEQIKKERGMK